MGTDYAFPYATDRFAVAVTLSSTNPGVTQRSDGTWDAFSNSVHKATFEANIDIDVERLEACLPSHLDSSAVEVVVSLVGLHSRERSELVTFNASSNVAEVSLDASDYVGRVDLQVAVRLREGHPRTPGFAYLKHSRIAEVPLATVWFTEPPQSTGDALEIRWEDFDEDGDLVDGQLFAVRLEDRPVIILNSAITSAYEILGSKGNHGAAARIRDAVFMQVVHQAWSSILSHCLMEVMRHDEDATDETVLAELVDWQGQVLRAWALEFEPNESSPEAATLALIEEARSPGSEVLIRKLPEAIQNKCSTIDGFNGLIRDFDKFQGASK